MIFLAIMLLTFSLVACEPANFFYSYEELKENVERVELINYNNPEAKPFSNKNDSLLSFDFEKMEVVEVLAAEKVDDFLKALSEVQFFKNMGHMDSPNGKCIRVVYNNGDFEIIHSDNNGNYVGSFDAEGNVKRFVGSVAYSLEDVTKYFDAQID